LIEAEGAAHARPPFLRDRRLAHLRRSPDIGKEKGRNALALRPFVDEVF